METQENSLQHETEMSMGGEALWEIVEDLEHAKGPKKEKRRQLRATNGGKTKFSWERERGNKKDVFGPYGGKAQKSAQKSKRV